MVTGRILVESHEGGKQQQWRLWFKIQTLVAVKGRNIDAAVPCVNVCEQFFLQTLSIQKQQNKKRKTQ